MGSIRRKSADNQQLLLKVPSFILGPIIVGGVSAFSAAGVLIVHRLITRARLKTHHDVADPILGALAAVYAVLLAFVVVTVWQSFDKSNANVQPEANYLADIYSDSEAFSPAFHQAVGGLLRQYRQAVVDLRMERYGERPDEPRSRKLNEKNLVALY